MHLHQISVQDLADKMGTNRVYLSALLNCKREPKNAEERCRAALNEIIAEKEQMNGNHQESC